MVATAPQPSMLRLILNADALADRGLAANRSAGANSTPHAPYTVPNRERFPPPHLSKRIIGKKTVTCCICRPSFPRSEKEHGKHCSETCSKDAQDLSDLVVDSGHGPVKCFFLLTRVGWLCSCMPRPLLDTCLISTRPTPSAPKRCPQSPQRNMMKKRRSEPMSVCWKVAGVRV